MSLEKMLIQLNNQQADFEDVQSFIAQHYDYRPCRFINGVGQNPVINEAGQNEGSCRLFALAQLYQLSEQDTLRLYGRFFREVVANPEGSDHANIRRFINDGWAGIQFEGEPLVLKTQK
jgi:hypothetical protein